MGEKNEIKEALGKALDIEQQGYLFYTESAKHTPDKNGAAMFWWLAGEEKKHFERIRAIWAEDMQSIKPPEFSPDTAALNYRIFKKTSSETEDELDALNTGITAEESSIALYSYLSKHAGLSGKARRVFHQLMGEEEKHLAILNKEVEFVTKTGEYTDFRTVAT